MSAYSNKSQSTMQKKLNDCRRQCTKYMISSTLYHHQVKLWARFLNKLLLEKRITKEEMGVYSPRKGLTFEQMMAKRKR